MPRLIILRLPNDHTSGTRRRQADADGDGRRQRPGARPGGRGGSARASSGRRRRSSSSRTTPRTAPTTSTPTAPSPWSISPYIKRKRVDSTHVLHVVSMLRTMELILGLEPMSQFDAAARPMSDSFTGEARPDALHARRAGRRPEREEPGRRLGGGAVGEARTWRRRTGRRPAVQRDHLEGR